MIQLVFGHDTVVTQWVQQQLPGISDFGPCAAIGVADGNRLIAGVVYTNYHGHMIEASLAATDRRWANRRILRGLFRYPFAQLQVRRFQVTIAKRNKSVRRFVVRLGFKFEGIGREGWHSGGDCAVYSMLRKDAERWLKPIEEASDNGQKLTKRAAGS